MTPHLMLMMLQTTKYGVCFGKYEKHGSKSIAKRQREDVKRRLFIDLPLQLIK